jgi:hypothetical protein
MEKDGKTYCNRCGKEIPKDEARPMFKFSGSEPWIVYDTCQQCFRVLVRNTFEKPRPTVLSWLRILRWRR